MPPQNWFLKSAYQADLDLHPISILIKLPRHFSFAVDLQYAAKKNLILLDIEKIK